MQRYGRCGFLVFMGILFYGLFSPSAMAVTEDEQAPRKAIITLVDSLNNSWMALINTDLDTILIIGSEALKLSQAYHYPRGEILANEGLAMYYYGKADYLKSLDFLYKNIGIHAQQKLREGLVKTHFRISGVYLTIKMFDKAWIHIKQSLSLALIFRDAQEMTQVYYSLSNFYYSTSDYKNVTRNAFLCISYAIKSKNPDMEARSYKMIGDACLKLKEYHKAIYYYGIALNKFASMRNISEIGIIYTRVAHVYQEMLNYQQALIFEKMALEVRKTIGKEEFVGTSMVNVGSDYLRLNQRDSAYHYLLMGLNILEKCDNFYLLDNAYYQMYRYYLSGNDFSNALRFYQAYLVRHQKNLDEANRSEIGILEANRLVAEAENRNKALKQVNDLQELNIRASHIQMFLFEVMLLLILISILYIYSLYQKNRLIKNKQMGLHDRLEKEIKERIEDEGKLRQSESLYRFLAENSVDVISHLDLLHGRLYVSPSCVNIYGYSQDEMRQFNDPLELVSSEFKEGIQSRYSEMIRTKTPTNFIYKATRKDGSTFWAESVVNPVVDEKTGETGQLITVVRDISERMKHEDALSANARQKEILLKEIHNRVKNNFAILVSLMNMQKDIAQDIGLTQSLSDLQLRVKTMSLVHEQLYSTRSIDRIPFSDYMLNLVNIISEAFAIDHVNLHTEIEECYLNIELALPLGLIVNELLTNAFKYAFPGQRPGSIRVSLNSIHSPAEDTENRTWKLSIEDNGVGLPDQNVFGQGKSMGGQIVLILVEQIEAKLQIDSTHGTKFRITFQEPSQQKSSLNF